MWRWQWPIYNDTLERFVWSSMNFLFIRNNGETHRSKTTVSFPFLTRLRFKIGHCHRSMKFHEVPWRVTWNYAFSPRPICWIKCTKQKNSIIHKIVVSYFLESSKFCLALLITRNKNNYTSRFTDRSFIHILNRSVSEYDIITGLVIYLDYIRPQQQV